MRNVEGRFLKFSSCHKLSVFVSYQCKMPIEHKVEHLVVDTTAFIKNANIQDIASNFYTVQGVVDEIRNKRQLRNLVVLPYDLKIKDVFPENIKFVTEFSKKTGDYGSLSAVDIQVIALTYQLEKEYVGVSHLNTEPKVQKVQKLSKQLDTASYLGIAGFYMPSKKNANSPVAVQDAETTRRAPEVEVNEAEQELHDRQLQIEKEDNQAVHDLEEALHKSKVTEGSVASESAEEDAAYSAGEEEYEEEEEEVEEDEEVWEESESGWITPENVEEAKKDLQTSEGEKEHVPVSCMTSDFAMQNVIKQMGMKTMAVDGRLIKQMRTYILRCYACFKTTSKMESIFCPHCGNRTLRRAAVLLKADGTEEIQIGFRRPPTGRGKRFAIPKPQGGKHAVKPLLCADQIAPQQRTTKLARTKNNPLEPDYIAGFSPFVMRDITSQSAVLGIRNNCSVVKNWMRKNPNEVVNKGKNKRR